MKIFSNYKIQTKILIGFAIIMLFLMFIGIRDLIILKRYDAKSKSIVQNFYNIEGLKEFKYLINKEILTSLSLINAEDLQALELHWQIHEADNQNFKSNLDSIRNFVNLIEDERHFLTRKKIIYSLTDIGDEYANIVLPTINTIRNIRQDIIETPIDDSKAKTDIDEGGVIFDDEKLVSPSNTIDDSPEDGDGETENLDLLDDVFKNIDDDQGGEVIQSESGAGSPVFDSFQEDDSVEVDEKSTSESAVTFTTEEQDEEASGASDAVETIGLRKKRMLDSYNYVNATCREIIRQIEQIEKNLLKIVQSLQTESDTILASSIRSSIILIFVIFVISLLVVILIARSISQPLVKIHNFIYSLGEGELPGHLSVETNDEIGKMTQGLNHLVDGLFRTSEFSLEIGKGNFTSKFEPLSSKDVLGNSLINMRKSLQVANEEEAKRKIEDQRRNWATEGLAQFNEILRQNSGNIETLTDSIVNSLVKYLNANQGGFFVYDDRDPDEPFLKLVATYAYNRKKYMEKKVNLGEGLVGMCALEKYTIYLTDVPDEYIEIESGLGYANPKCILITPLKVEDNILGIIELASFNEFAQHEIELVERISESIASTLSSIKISARTAELLDQSRSHTIEMQESDEKMRQTIEMLQATQEEAIRQEKKLRKDLDDARQEVEFLRNKNLELEQNLTSIELELKKHHVKEVGI